MDQFGPWTEIRNSLDPPSDPLAREARLVNETESRPIER